MENAAKALLMAGGVLIGILILTLAAYLFASFGGTSQMIQDRISQGSLDQFNNKFVSYQSKQCTIYDVLTIVNYANEFNEKNEFTEEDENYYIKVTGPNDISNNLEIKDIETDIKNNGGKYGSTINAGEIDAKFELKKYKCIITINDMTERVNKIVFENWS